MAGKTAHLELGSPRLDFNGGFHDAHADKAKGYDRRPSYPGQQKDRPLPAGAGYKHYRAGYEFGYVAECRDPRCSSDAAWKAYRADGMAGVGSYPAEFPLCRHYTKHIAAPARRAV